ncbi:MAG: hypothetical protein A2X92_02545 [Syntrophus sp. GWC2_56_31]|nr:MAG: hypothetical protein A2X92_02545 [Syntrophus sp. GWC2_56_31]
MGDCRCGCGEPANNGDFIAGHSQKLTSSLVKEVGGLFALQELIQSAKQYSYGEKRTKEFLDLIRRIFPVKNLK